MYDLSLLRMLFLQPLTTHVLGILMSALIMMLFGFLLWRGASAPPPELVPPVERPPEVFLPFPEDEIPLPVLPVPEKEGRAPVPGLV